MKKQQLCGFLYIISAAIFYGVMPLIAKLIYQGGCNAESLVLFRGTLSIPVVYLLMKMEGTVKLSPKQYGQIFILTALGICMTQLLLYMSYDYIPIGLATTIHYCYPIFVLIGSVIFFKDKLTKVKLLCVVLTTIGIALFYTPGGSINLTGIILAFVSGITFAFYLVYMEKTGLKNIPSFQLCLYISIFTGIIMSGYTVATKTLVYDFSPKLWLVIFVFSLVINMLANIFFQRGIRYIGSQKSSILATFEPVTSIVLGIAFFNDPLTFNIVIGIVLILSAVLAISLLGSSNSTDSDQLTD